MELGPHANDTEVLLGNYHATPGIITTPLQGIIDKVQGTDITVTYSQGCEILGEGTWMFGEAIPVAQQGKNSFWVFISNNKQADVAIVFLGLSMKRTPDGMTQPYGGIAIEKEALDRESITLPYVQRDLLKGLKLHQTTPIILVLVNGGPVALDWEAKNLDTIVEVSESFWFRILVWNFLRTFYIDVVSWRAWWTSYC